MTIEQAIAHATAGGYHIDGSDGMETPHTGASTAYSAWTRKDNQSTFMVAVEATFLDPEFWQALGRTLGWDHAIVTVQVVDKGRPTVGTSARHHWRSHWHRFIDSLADGHDVASFFAHLAPV